MKLLRRTEKRYGIKINIKEKGIYEHDGKVFDSLYSIFAYMGRADEYDYFLADCLGDAYKEVQEETVKYKKYEQALFEIEELFHSIPNLTETKKDDGVYRFTQDTEFTYKGNKYKAKRQARVFILKNFAGQKVGIVVQRDHKGSAIIFKKYGLIIRPFYERKALENKIIQIVTRDDYKHWLLKWNRIYFEEAALYYLITFLKKHPEIDYEFSIEFPRVPNPKILLKYPGLKALFYKNYKLHGVHVKDWLINYNFYPKLAKSIYKIVSSINILEEVHPEFLNDFLKIKEYLKQCANPVRKVKKQKLPDIIETEDYKKASYLMRSIFEHKTENARFVLVCRETGAKFYYEPERGYKTYAAINYYLKRNGIYDKYKELNIDIAPKNKNRAIQRYLTEQFRIFSEGYIEYNEEKNKWNLYGKNGCIGLKGKDPKFIRNFTELFESPFVLNKKRIDEVPSGNTFYYRKGVRTFFSKETYLSTYAKREKLVYDMIGDFPLYYLLGIRYPFGLFFFSEKVYEEFIDIIKANAIFTIEEEDIKKIFTIHTAYKYDAFTFHIGEKELNDRIDSIRSREFRNAMRRIQRLKLVTLFQDCKTLNCVYSKMERKIKNTKRIASLRIVDMAKKNDSLLMAY